MFTNNLSKGVIQSKHLLLLIRISLRDNKGLVPLVTRYPVETLERKVIKVCRSWKKSAGRPKATWLSEQPKWHSTLRGRTVMKNNKITAEEHDTGKLAKFCSERKLCRRKCLATLCPSSLSGRHECITWYTHYLC